MRKNLDRRIRIYRIKEERDNDGNVYRIKKYLNREGGFFKAQFRGLSSTETLANRELKEDATCQFTINPRAVTTDCLIEFERPLYGLETYQITGIDSYEDKRNSYYIIRAKRIIPEVTDGEEWSIPYGME